jgi:hypothetical protein
MTIINTTDWPDPFLKRMVSWCCKELGISPKEVKQYKLRNKSDGFTSGHCYSYCGWICVSLGIVNFRDGTSLKSGPVYRRKTIRDLVSVTAHEVAHRMSHVERIPSRKSRRYNRVLDYGGSERQTCWHERKLLASFLADRDELYRKWMGWEWIYEI